MAAKKGESLDIVEYLINKEANINIKDYNGVSGVFIVHLFCCLKSFISLQALKQMSPTLNLPSEIVMHVFVPRGHF